MCDTGAAKKLTSKVASGITHLEVHFCSFNGTLCPEFRDVTDYLNLRANDFSGVRLPLHAFLPSRHFPLLDFFRVSLWFGLLGGVVKVGLGG